MCQVVLESKRKTDTEQYVSIGVTSSLRASSSMHFFDKHRKLGVYSISVVHRYLFANRRGEYLPEVNRSDADRKAVEKHQAACFSESEEPVVGIRHTALRRTGTSVSLFVNHYWEYLDNWVFPAGYSLRHDFNDQNACMLRRIILVTVVVARCRTTFMVFSRRIAIR